jgi:hypothetical protein
LPHLYGNVLAYKHGSKSGDMNRDNDLETEDISFELEKW